MAKKHRAPEVADLLFERLLIVCSARRRLHIIVLQMIDDLVELYVLGR